MNEKKEIEIYESREVQELIGYIPTSLQKWGVYVIALFMAILLVGSCFFRYPKTLKGSVIIPPSEGIDTVSGIMHLPPSNFGEVREGAKVLVFTEAYPESEYGFLTGTVNRVYGILDKSGNYRVEIYFPKGLLTSQGSTLSARLQLTGTGEVILKESTLIEALIKPIRLPAGRKK